jgi:dienelactone hydrolase
MRPLALFLVALSALGQRPLRHSDYDSWNAIVSPQVSDNGRFLLYGLFPQAGNGYVVIRDLNTDAEIRQPAGERPAPPPPDFSGEESAPPARGVTAGFTADGLYAAFQTFPTREAREKARREKAKDAPAGDLVIANLATGQVWRVEQVKSFQLPENSSERLAYLTAAGKLVSRSLIDQSEKSFDGALEYRLHPDGASLAYLSRQGAFRAVLPEGNVQTLVEGAGKYAKLAASESGDRLAFVRDTTLYVWSSGDAAAAAAAEKASEYGAVSFSAAGSRIFFGLRPDSPREALPGEGAVFDLWHYRDDFIQPMQRVRAKTEREWSERAVFLVAEKKVVPLSAGLLTRVIPSRDGRSAIGVTDRPYRRLRERDAAYVDLYALDVDTGARKLLEKQARAAPVLSPDGRYAVGFVGRQWVCWELSTGFRRELTALTGRAFFREDYDAPQEPPAYGQPVWTRDSRWVLIPDRFDVWAFAPDGSAARNLTDGFGRRENLELRVVNLREDPKAPGLDPQAPILLKAEHLASRDSGFFRDSLDPAVQPQQLTMGPVSHRAPLAAKKADVLLVAPAKFNVFPDWHVTNSEMKITRQVTNANPQARELAFGASRLIRYRNGDGKELAAALFTPAGFDPAKKYPMLVYIYETLSQNVNDFREPAPGTSINVTYYTSNGYVVLMPDIVYTVGYPGGSALKCVVPAVQKVVEMGFVDPARIGIQGHSWGGYQIAYMITQTNLFRAAAPGALVANMISAYDGIRWGPGIPRQFQYEKAQSRIGGTPWEFPLRYIENSPIFMADRIRTPVLMLHNDADDAVPWYQGIEFFLALRRLDKEVYFFNYNGEGHGLRNRVNQLDYTVRLQEFFDHYLKDAPMPAWMREGRPYVDKRAAGESAPPPSDQ